MRLVSRCCLLRHCGVLLAVLLCLASHLGSAAEASVTSAAVAMDATAAAAQAVEHGPADITDLPAKVDVATQEHEPGSALGALLIGAVLLVVATIGWMRRHLR